MKNLTCARSRKRRAGRPPRLEQLEERTLLSVTTVALNAQTTGLISGPGEVDTFVVSVPEDGVLSARVHAADFSTRLSLLDDSGRLLIQSDGQSLTNPDDLIRQHLQGSPSGTTYLLTVSGLSGAAGGFTLRTEFLASASPLQPVPVGAVVPVVVTGDFNGDGRLDLAVTDASASTVNILLGDGDGGFRALAPIPVTATDPAALVAADFNRDGHLDLAVLSGSSSNLSVLLGNGDGTFRALPALSTAGFADTLAVGDFNGDGHPDLVTGSSFGPLTVLLGNGDGTFHAAGPAQFVGFGRISFGVGDFNGDGNLDLAVASTQGGIVLLLGDGHGGLHAAGPALLGNADLVSMVAEDFNGDGRLDLAVADAAANTVQVLLGDGRGHFRAAVGPASLAASPRFLTTGDFNGDGRLDLAVGDDSGALTVLLGDGGGGLRAAALPENVSAQAGGAVAADFNGDGRLDLAVTDYPGGDVILLFGNGDGSMRAAVAPVPLVGQNPNSMVEGDFNGDGQTDLAILSDTSGAVTILLGNGDGTFHPAGPPVPVEPGFGELAVGDFNGDGRLDLAIAYFGGDVGVLLGNGDGTFRAAPFSPRVGQSPINPIVADFNGDGRPDLAVLDDITGALTVLLGNGDGTFRPAGASIAEGSGAKSMVEGDFNGDGRPDLAVADVMHNRVAVLLGNGDGTFHPAGPPLAAGDGPIELAVGDFNGDGHLDLVVGDVGHPTGFGPPPPGSQKITVLLGAGNGTFHAAGPALTLDVTSLGQLVVGDFNGDGRLDVGALDGGVGVLILLGNGDGTLTPGSTVATGPRPFPLVTGDFDGNGRPDLAVADFTANTVSVLLNGGDGNFFPAGIVSDAPPATPLLADLNGDGVPDLTVLRQDGAILFRAGRANDPGAFDPPVIVNAVPARDVTVVTVNGRPELAALDAQDAVISLYAFDPGTGTFRRTAGPAVPGLLPVRIAAGDLNGDRRDDLAVTAAGSDQVFVFLQGADGRFSALPDYTAGVGASPFGLQIVDVNGDGRPDLVVANQFSGDVSVLLNDPTSPFAKELRFRAGLGPYGMGRLVPTAAVPTAQALEGRVAVAALDANGDGRTDLVTLNELSDSAAVLLGDGSGGVLNPQPDLTLAAGLTPTAIAVGDFNGDGVPDLAVLDKGSGTITLYLGQGDGRFTRAGSVPAGNVPTGLTAVDVNGDGQLDLLVGNQYGDVLILLGNGDGTFSQPVRVDRSIGLAVLGGAGGDVAVLSDRSRDRLAVQPVGAGASLLQGSEQGVLAPGAVRFADVGGTEYLVVANGGGNDVLVYRVGAAGLPDASTRQEYFAGADPVGITIGDVNQDGIPDVVVANAGSNDVSILLGQGSGPNWTLTYGPRLRAGLGPTSTAIVKVPGRPFPALVVNSSQSGTAVELPGKGQGFFQDQHPIALPTGQDPVAVAALPGGGVAVVNAGSNDLTIIPDLANPSAFQTIGSGGDQPVALVAGDFNGDGFPDLAVANTGNGVVSLLLGGPDGFHEARAATELDHPTDLAVAQDGATTRVYGASEGREAAVLLFTFTSAGPPGPPPLPGSADVADLRPLANQTLAVTALLLTVNTGEEAATGTEPALAPTALESDVVLVPMALASGVGPENDEIDATAGDDSAVLAYVSGHAGPAVAPGGHRHDGSPVIEEDLREEQGPAPAVLTELWRRGSLTAFTQAAAGQIVPGLIHDVAEFLTNFRARGVVPPPASPGSQGQPTKEDRPAANADAVSSPDAMQSRASEQQRDGRPDWVWSDERRAKAAELLLAVLITSAAECPPADGRKDRARPAGRA